MIWIITTFKFFQYRLWLLDFLIQIYTKTKITSFLLMISTATIKAFYTDPVTQN